MEDEKEKLIKIIKECNNPEELELLKVLMTELYKDIKNLRTNKFENDKDSNTGILDRYLRSFDDFPNIKAGTIWNHIEANLGIYTVRDLINTPPHNILKFKGIGKKRITELQEWLAKYGLKFIGT